jgi:hypothetical protein
MKLQVKALGLTLGIYAAIVVFLITLISLWIGQGNTIGLLKTVFLFGYSRSIAGAFVGAIWGFVYGFIDGALIAWLYNMFAKESK